MPSSTASKRFLQVYDALPPDAQHLLVRKHLVPLLDTVSKDAQKSTTATATELQRRYARMPSLNLKAKKAEIATLMLELSRDSRRSLIKERSRREQLLSEAVDSLVQWLNDIWKVAYEFRTNFTLAHTCLLFARDVLDQIGTGTGGCGCSFTSMFIPIRITSSNGKVVKSFVLNGAQNLENVMLWIWRDLFMTVLATGSKHQRNIVPNMIDDIRVVLGWRALEQLLRGGSKSFFEEEHEDEDDHVHEPEQTAKPLNVIDDEDDRNYTSDDCSSICDEELYPRLFYAPHWSWRITDQQSRLRDLVHTALLDIFKVAPSGPLYSSMVSIAEDEDDLEEELHPLIMSVAGHSSDNLSAALRIMSLNNRTESVNKLLRAYKHLLRPQDAASLQFAVLIMSSNFFYRTHAISIVEEELLDVSNVFRAAIRSSFCNIGSEVNKSELKQILALRRDSLHRHTRVERWVKGVLTPQVNTPHPMALAALMIGIPLPPGADGTDEGDMLGYIELDGDDPEQEDLREEFRPNIKARLQGWVDTAVAIKGGSAMLLKMYAGIIGDMPFLRGSDVVEEMSARIGDRPSKSHVCDALEAFRDFCEKQRLKLAAAKGKGTRMSRSNPSVPGPGPNPTSSVPQAEPPTSDPVMDAD
ncbi:hypothetical protein J3R82DRAFT_3570 [Butyriboletus roseoflavus]|nr:hypothetical protein J3R82DRAFT_3570 [Butyriboletus roseoflavus]